jgi:hypothetical protein
MYKTAEEGPSTGAKKEQHEEKHQKYERKENPVGEITGQKEGGGEEEQEPQEG